MDPTRLCHLPNLTSSYHVFSILSWLDSLRYNFKLNEGSYPALETVLHPHLTSILILALLEKQLLQRVKAVTEDEIYLTIEFNEFLKMMSEESKEDLKIENLIEAFKYIH